MLATCVGSLGAALGWNYVGCARSALVPLVHDLRWRHGRDTCQGCMLYHCSGRIFSHTPCLVIPPGLPAACRAFAFLACAAARPSCYFVALLPEVQNYPG